jgi:hydroxymethylpyrimidine pyrophosphatase-like HAD family hydrolase
MTRSSPKTNGKVRLVASDLDGTLLRSDGSVSERTREALARTLAAGIRFLLASARSPAWLGLEARRLGLDGIGICANGALIYDFQRENVLRHRPLEPALAHSLAQELRASAPGIAFGCERPSGFVAEPTYRPLFRPPDSIPRAELEVLFAEPVTKLVLQHPDLAQHDLHALVDELCGDDAVATYSGAGLVEIAAAGVDKGSALASICADLDIEAAEVVAFGDMPNDVSMLRWAGLGIAVANAHADVVAAADEITASNDEDGVALALERALSRD